MKNFLIITLTILCVSAHGQQYVYEPSDKFPYGKPNPNAPKEIRDWEELIGMCSCKSVARIDQTTWADTIMMDWKEQMLARRRCALGEGPPVLLLQVASFGNDMMCDH